MTTAKPVPQYSLHTPEPWDNPRKKQVTVDGERVLDHIRVGGNEEQNELRRILALANAALREGLGPIIDEVLFADEPFVSKQVEHQRLVDLVEDLSS